MRRKTKEELHKDFFSLAAQILREIRPSRLDEAKKREAMKERERRQSPEYKEKNRLRMQEKRKKT
jgi:hypothetical protein